jgi:hypothetical protein
MKESIIMQKKGILLGPRQGIVVVTKWHFLDWFRVIQHKW